MWVEILLRYSVEGDEVDESLCDEASRAVVIKVGRIAYSLNSSDDVQNLVLAEWMPSMPVVECQ